MTEAGRPAVAAREPRLIVGTEELAAAVRRLGEELSEAYPAGFLMVAVLKGSIPFVADLLRATTVPVELDFLAISAYSEGSGRVRLVKDLEQDVIGRDVVLVEDIVDTGLTLNYVMGEILRREPRTLAVCTLFDRARRRLVPTPLRFVGFTIDDDYALGYGLDYKGRYRNLSRVVAGDPNILHEEPDAYVGHLYPR